MSAFEGEGNRSGFDLQGVLQMIRVVGACCGLVAIIMGLVFASRVFKLVSGTMREPESFRAYLATWMDVLGGNTLTIMVNGTPVQAPGLFALLVVGVGTILMAVIALGIVMVGARTLSWTLSDHEAVKRVLTHAFGPKRRPDQSKTE